MKRKLNTIQRKSLLVLTKAYHTTATSSLQVLSGIPSIHPIAIEETKYIKLAGFRKPITVQDQLVNPTEYQEMIRSHLIHPAYFHLENQISLNPAAEYPTLNSTFTDGSKNNEGISSAFCCFNVKNEITSE
ncbi:hypothetical protein AVEN_239152-1 [Araneus ventricosus]|uniref:Uncharacterized protein n=1 Tax=Araneus ventricosus TaxID=182803 RepID=A0A4Y2H9U9_ARAVE|nr:hypothetical protein AVEN_239152-1 [Araneus ventricosus]